MIMFKIYRKLYIRVYGEMKWAIKNGMRVEKNCCEVGGVNYGSEPYLITLGDYVKISDHVQFFTHDGGSWVFRRTEAYKDIVAFGRITIGNNCFIGSHAIILPNVVIGDNVVIGAGAIVTRDIPSNSVAAGAPARVISSIDSYAEKMKKKMPENWDSNLLLHNKKKYLQSIL